MKIIINLKIIFLFSLVIFSSCSRFENEINDLSIIINNSNQNDYNLNRTLSINEDIKNFTINKSDYNTTINYNLINISEVQENISLNNLTYSELNSFKLLPPKNEKIYFGAFPDFGGPEDIVTEKKIIDFENLIGRKIVWASFSQNWYNGIYYPKEEIHIINDLGIIPYVRFMPRSSDEEFYDETKFTLNNIIEGKFDNDLKNWAKDSKEDGIPIIIDFAVEMNGDWFPWSGYYNGAGDKTKYGDPNYYDGPERYRDAYRHIIDIFRAENITHITWFFHVDIYSNPNEDWNQPKYYYPGDDYIDWIGISCYGPMNTGENYWELFSEILEERSNSILEISNSKPFAVLEFGVTDNSRMGNKSEWLKDAFRTILNKKPIKFSAISYWHENWEEENGDLALIRVDTSNSSLKIFRELAKNNKFTSKPIFD